MGCSGVVGSIGWRELVACNGVLVAAPPAQGAPSRQRSKGSAAPAAGAGVPGATSPGPAAAPPPLCVPPTPTPHRRAAASTLRQSCAEHGFRLRVWRGMVRRHARHLTAHARVTAGLPRASTAPPTLSAIQTRVPGSAAWAGSCLGSASVPPSANSSTGRGGCGSSQAWLLLYSGHLITPTHTHACRCPPQLDGLCEGGRGAQ